MTTETRTETAPEYTAAAQRLGVEIPESIAWALGHGIVPRSQLYWTARRWAERLMVRLGSPAHQLVWAIVAELAGSPAKADCLLRNAIRRAEAGYLGIGA